MDAKVSWKGRMSFEGMAGTGFTVPLGTEPSVGGDNDGFLPIELMLVSLAGCTAMDVVSILNKKRQDVTGFEVQVQAPRAEAHPKVFLSARINYRVTGRGVDEAALVRAIELSATRYCPAQAMLGKAFPMELHYQIYEQDGGDEPVIQGVWNLPQETLRGN
ncbi:MAG: OsmC family protein [Chloroflexota bacterium]